VITRDREVVQMPFQHLLHPSTGFRDGVVHYPAQLDLDGRASAIPGSQLTDRSIATLEVKFCISAPTGFLARGWSLLGVQSAGLTLRRSLPVYPDQRSSPDRPTGPVRANAGSRRFARGSGANAALDWKRG
jgi:hypothetical protein